MTKLLFIKASPRGEASTSVAVAQAFVNAAIANNPSITIDTIDLWAEALPDFDGDKNAAKFNVMLGQEHNEVQQSAWDQIAAIANRFAAADHYVFAIPMWNGAIPYKLKHYIDIIHQPGILFSLDPATGYSGLLANKKATVILTSGAYSQNAPSPAYGIDHQSPYIRAWLNQAGVSDIDEIRFQPTLLTADPKADLENAIAKANQLALNLR